ncbi:MAG: hypothetical protein EAZ18_00150 [Oscillatoriales cyanobacterium]|nr:MAG: hypothetical protein EAZ18_00150 [Oscillatoriales cyanobacterium]
MPTQFAAATATAATLTETTTAKIVRNRHCSGSAGIATVGSALGLARDRYVSGMNAKTGVSGSAVATRKRSVAATCLQATGTRCDRGLVSMPAVIAPEGQLWLNGKPFKSQPMQKGQSLQIRFELLGRKLSNLRARFKLFDLQGNTLIDKLETIAPGGLEIESETVQPGGLTNYIGYIFLDRTETLFAQFSREFETEYEFEIGNSRINYPIERGFLTFSG